VSHARLWTPKGSASAVAEHRPKSHREYGAWPPSRIITWAAAVGPSVGALVEHILRSRDNPETAYRSCMALIRSAKGYDPCASTPLAAAPSTSERPPARACWRS
jgi:hypothetical protein